MIGTTIKLDEKTAKKVKAQFDNRVSALQSIEHLSNVATKANGKMWDEVFKAHPELDRTTFNFSYNAKTGEVVCHGYLPGREPAGVEAAQAATEQ